MKHFHDIYRKRMLGFGLLSLFLFYFVGSSCFTHTHITENAVVVHSHYYAQPWKAGSNATPAHTHTTNQYQLILHLNQLVFTMTTLGLVLTVYHFATYLFYAKCRGIVSVEHAHRYLRGPPSCHPDTVLP